MVTSVHLSGAPPPTGRDESPIHVLVVDDDAAFRRSLTRLLLARNFKVDTCDGGAAALEYIATNDPDAALVDLQMPGMDGLEVLRRLREIRPGLAVIMMTGFADVAVAVEALRSGAFHFLTKPFASNDAVALTVEKAAMHRRLADHARQLELRLQAQERFGELIGTSQKMLAVYRVIDGVAATTSTVLILGESGTGKELAARAIHQRSGRSQRSFVPVNCAAIPKELVESELFGHVRGAFTGADRDRIGAFEAADGGTVFLDEIGELPIGVQPKLLRALEQREIRRVGETATRKVNVRVISATNRDLEREVNKGTFREDLYFRIAVITVRVPPLRDRAEDLPHLIRAFLKLLDAKDSEHLFPTEVMEELARHEWPGNVRELRNYVERSVVLQTARMSLPPPSMSSGGGSSGAAGSAGKSADVDVTVPFKVAKDSLIDGFERAYLRWILEAAGGNMTKAARMAGIDRMYLHRLVQKHGTRDQLSSSGSAEPASAQQRKPVE